MIDLNEFTLRYKEHLDWLSINLNPNCTLTQIFQVFSSVHSNGGWARTVGLDNWDSVTNMPDGRFFYENNFLVSFERILNSAWPYSAEITKEINFSLLKSIEITTQVRPDQWEELLSDDLILYRDVYKLGLKENLTSLQSLKEKHGDEEITVIVQESDTSGFSVKKATKQKMKLKKYIGLMEQNFRDDKYVRFAVNVDIGNWSEEIDEIRKYLPSEVLWCSKDDSLLYLRQHILGMTLPQLYLKINGCWTGGHEENLRFCSANINHGPSACEWWGLDSSQSLQLRERIKVDKNFEIYNSETLWWPDEIYCIIQGFTLYHVIQKPGDLVIVGPGTIHWVKSCGVTTNTAWNFGPKYLNNFIKSFERDFINRAIQYKSLVPMYLLSLDLLNNEMNTLDIGLVEYLKDAILAKENEENFLWVDSKYKNIELNNVDNVIHCESCYLEIFRLYYKCKKCVENRFAGGNKTCFFCYFCVGLHSKECTGTVVAAQKFLRKDLMKLVNIIDRRVKGSVLGMGIEDLKYPFDKNTEENTYVSPYNGILTYPNSKLPPPIHPPTKSNLKKSFKPAKSKNPALNTPKKLSSLTAKKKMSELACQSNLDQLLKSYSSIQPEKAIFMISEKNEVSAKIEGKKIESSKECEKKEPVKEKIVKKEPTKEESEKKEQVKEERKKMRQVRSEIKLKSRKDKKNNCNEKEINGKERRENLIVKSEVVKEIENELLRSIKMCEFGGDEGFGVPSKRFRSTDIYSPVLGLIPAKVTKVALA